MEKYGIPITISGEGIETINYNILLNEPLRNSTINPNYIDYIDFINKKVVRNVKKEGSSLMDLNNPIEESIEVPDIPLGKKIQITVNTTVKPSKIETTFYTID